MTILHQLRLVARHFGLEINRYSVLTSQSKRLITLLSYNNIDLVLDVGANDGGYARELLRAGYSGNIISFEPLSEAHSKLTNSAKRYEKWHVAPRMALGDKDGEVEINIAGNSTSSSILEMENLHKEAAPQSVWVSKEKTTIARLDQFQNNLIQEAGNIYLKIDTQGYEKQVLDGAGSFLNKIQGVQLEMSLTPLYKGQSLYLEQIERLTASGFYLWGLFPGFSDPRSGRLLQIDGVFFRSKT